MPGKLKKKEAEEPEFTPVPSARKKRGAKTVEVAEVKSPADVPEEQLKEIAMQALDFKAADDKSKEFATKATKIKDGLKKTVAACHSETDKGHQVLEIPYADKVIVLQNTKKNVSVQRPEILDVLKKNKLKDCIEKIEVVRQDILEQKIAAGEVSDELLLEMFSSKPSYAFSVSINDKEKE